MNLICVSESHFDLDYYGGPGLKITPSVEGKDAKVEIEAFVTNMKPGQALRYSIFKPCGCPVASVETKETKASLEIKAVHLWHGRKDPYLYNAKVELVEKGAVLNWFDIDAPEGYLSLNDKMSDVIATMQGKLLFMTLMGKFLGGGKKNGDGKIKAAGFEVGPEMMSMMGGFTVLRLFTLMGGMMDVKFTKEQLLDLNAKLNKIKKPKEKK